MKTPRGIEVRGPAVGRAPELLSPGALAFLGALQRTFGAAREALLEERRQAARLAKGERPDFAPEARGIREGTWRVAPPPADLLDARVPGGSITGSGLRSNVAVALRDLEAWPRGTGAVAPFHRIEDTATAEIARAQPWPWVRRGARLREGPVVDRALVLRTMGEELARLGGSGVPLEGRWADARALLEAVALGEPFVDFPTLPAYAYLP